MDLWLRAGDTSLGVIVSQVADKIAKSSSGLRNIWCDFAQCILVTMVLLTKGQSSSGSTGFELGFEWLNLDCEIHLHSNSNAHLQLFSLVLRFRKKESNCTYLLFDNAALNNCEPLRRATFYQRGQRQLGCYL